jgi:hypothetical protein
MAEAFTPGTFQIFGGMEGASGDIAAAQRDHGRHARTSAQPRDRFCLTPGRRLDPGEDACARRLYFILPGGKAIEYHVGVGREGFTWSGTNVITRKAEWPDWRPPAEMIARERSKGP